MANKITAKHWAVRVLGATVATSAMLTAIALPASASDSWAVAYGGSEQAAVQNVKYTCMFARGGTMTSPIGTWKVRAERWGAEVICHVED